MYSKTENESEHLLSWLISATMRVGRMKDLPVLKRVPQEIRPLPFFGDDIAFL
ncbi:MAG: hypothetical protein ACMUHB_03930 [Thermoplasmatota archaeon]